VAQAKTGDCYTGFNHFREESKKVAETQGVRECHKKKIMIDKDARKAEFTIHHSFIWSKSNFTEQFCDMSGGSIAQAFSPLRLLYSILPSDCCQ
jgi:hypothetical protein